jgi:hypothetical protein
MILKNMTVKHIIIFIINTILETKKNKIKWNLLHINNMNILKINTILKLLIYKKIN